MLRDASGYLGLCALSLLCGLGLLRGLGVRLRAGQGLFFAPLASLAAWVCVLGAGVALGAPIRSFQAWLWGASLLSALLGAWTLARSKAARPTRSALLLALAAALPVLLMAPHFRAGLRDYSGVLFGDGWSYVADAQYLWTHPRGALGGLSLLHAYAAHLAQTRHASASLLAFLSPLARAGGDTQASVGLYLAWLVFLCACACAALGSARRLVGPRLLAFVLLALSSGWVGHVLAECNYDQALALALFPMLVAGVDVLGPQPGRAVLLGLTAGAALYAYPELCALGILGALLAGLRRFWRRPEGRRALVLGALGASGTAVLAVGPNLLVMATFAAHQLGAAGPRSGSTSFDGLGTPARLLSGLWALGGERLEAVLPDLRLATLLASGLSVLAALGALRLARRGHGDLVALGLAQLAGALALLQLFAHPYAAYKLLSFNYWVAGLALVAGLEAVLAARPRGRVLAAAAAVAVLAFASSEGSRRLRRVERERGFGLADFRALETLAVRVPPRGLALSLEGASAQQWTLYFLRGEALRVLDYRAYLALPHLAPALARARQLEWSQIGYLLTDSPGHPPLTGGTLELAWDAPPFRLWRLLGDVAVIDVKSDAGPCLGPRGASLRLLARQAGRVRIDWRAAEGPRSLTRQVLNGISELTLEPDGPSAATGCALDLGALRAVFEAQRADPTGPVATRANTSGEPDWLAQDETTGAVGLWSAEGRPKPQAGLGAPAASAALALVGEYAGTDGRPQLVFRDRRSGATLLSRADAGELQSIGAPPERGRRLAGVADVDRDGWPDLVYQDERSGEISLLALRGLEPAGWRSFRPSVPLAQGWRLARVQALGEDRPTALLWFSPSSGRAALWLVDAQGARVEGSLLKPPDGADWLPAGVWRGRGASVRVAWQRPPTGELRILSCEPPGWSCAPDGPVRRLPPARPALPVWGFGAQ